MIRRTLITVALAVGLVLGLALAPSGAAPDRPGTVCHRYDAVSGIGRVWCLL